MSAVQMWSHRQNRFRTALVVIIISLQFSGCATSLTPELEAADRSAKQFTPDPEKATLYVFRRSFMSFIGAIGDKAFQLQLPMSFDGLPVGTLKSKEYIRLSAPPGPHDIVVLNSNSRRPARLTLELEKGRLYFVEIILQAPVDLHPVRLVAVEERVGKRAVLDSTIIAVDTEPRIFR